MLIHRKEARNKSVTLLRRLVIPGRPAHIVTVRRESLDVEGPPLGNTPKSDVRARREVHDVRGGCRRPRRRASASGPWERLGVVAVQHAHEAYRPVRARRTLRAAARRTCTRFVGRARAQCLAEGGTPRLAAAPEDEAFDARREQHEHADDDRDDGERETGRVPRAAARAALCVVDDEDRDEVALEAEHHRRASR